MIVLRRERRFYVMIAVIVCVFFLYWWILKNIQAIDAPQPDTLVDSSEQISGSDEAESELPLGEDETDTSEPVMELEELAQRREILEKTKQEYRNQRDRLLVRLANMASSVEEAKSNEREMLDGWTVLNDQGLVFTETMAEDFVTIRARRSSLADNAGTLGERHALLKQLLQSIGGEDVGTLMGELTVSIDGLESDIDEYTRECGDIANLSWRLAERAKGSDRGEPLDSVLSRMEAAKVAPELGRLAEERISEIANECNEYCDEMVTQTRREAEARSQQRRAANEEAARTIRHEADNALAEHKSEQQRLDAGVEAKQRAFAFKRDRARIEHYLIPFIALERTYSSPSLLDGESREFRWANIPLEHAASLTEIEAMGVFDGNDESMRELEYYTRLRMRDDLGEQYLLFGQPWSYKDESYMMLVREILVKHGQAMVEAGLLRP